MRLDEVSGFNLRTARANFRQVLLDVAAASSEPFEAGLKVQSGGNAENISPTSYLTKFRDEIIEVLPIDRAPGAYAARVRIYSKKYRSSLAHPVLKALITGKPGRDVEFFSASNSKRFEGLDYLKEYDVEV